MFSLSLSLHLSTLQLDRHSHASIPARRSTTKMSDDQNYAGTCRGRHVDGARQSEVGRQTDREVYVHVLGNGKGSGPGVVA